ncbi:voltage-dependent calcium channel subunit alpha-2/delta-3 isoform X2 [Orussus abietinus]|uniref:voltage-dependent calcium channel subunit alpha-2/delta-3 isoform X2 n=1 Tax=Orussus abietinus TaxID=222816 RepID=UPI000C715B77|nr:voltage-dependent calcium channel subunit alpha-2/delta-3 isoform X2 [Orussus abietinus]
MPRYIGNLCFTAILLLIVHISGQQDEDIPHNEVKNWALKFGVDLWAFGKQVTRISEIQRKYHNVDADITRKDGLVLVRDMAVEVKNMMDFKINAIMRLMDSAEQAAKEGIVFPKYASHQSNVGKTKVDAGSVMTPNRHFDHLIVNVNLSEVLLPEGIGNDESQVATGIQWSEFLNPLFVNNYNSDPSLSWQYYGDSSGFLRRFPAISQVSGDIPFHSTLDSTRGFDEFRISNWFVGAATSPKDLAILIDSASFSPGRIRDLTIETTKVILDTLGPDDFVNVYRYAETTEEIVQCFKDLMVQASPENIRELKFAIETVLPDTKANISAAFNVAFNILHKYNRTGQGSQCNQVILLLTSEAREAPMELIKKYNWPHMPVRIFVYQIGGGRSPELQSVACTNKGHYSRITSIKEITTNVFDYVKVLARPMVLYQHDHPIHWSPVHVTGKINKYTKEYSAQLMTSVTAPILDRRNHTVKSAKILGVVGTDVPVEQVQKLVPAYKLGVNGYSFIVDNNGRVLYHPDLRPTHDESSIPRFVGVDLTEVELADYDGPFHPVNNSFLLDLRRDMIEQKEGETDFAVKIHYDNMKRVVIRRHNYFYTPIEGTPFSLGLALPENYGMYELLAEQEIKHATINVTEYFNGTNWKVHPDWVYCEYSASSEKIFATPEEQILHFLGRSRQPGWKWMSLRPRSPSSHHKQASIPDKDAYYCDKTLVQSLVLDALVTEGFGRSDGTALHKEENQNQGKGRFGVTRSFIATRSGLLRWHDHQQNEEITDPRHFANVYTRAMEASWYRRAVDQHDVEPESFVFSVPFNAAESTSPLVTATHAVFVESKGHQAPAAVVGLQFRHSSLASHFLNVTSTCSGKSGCKKNCASEELDCYILDNNGFIIISEQNEHTGKFFGEIDGTIMDSLVQDRIYRKVAVTDYQGSCYPQESHISSATTTISQSIANMISIFGSFLLDMTFRWCFHGIWLPTWGLSEEIQSNDNHIYTDDDRMQHFGPRATDSTDRPFLNNEEFATTPDAILTSPFNPAGNSSGTHNYPYRLSSCEKKTDLYILQPERLNTSGQSNPLKGKLTNCHVTGCERPFSVQKIQHTNLILLVVDTLCPCGSKRLTIEPVQVDIQSGACTTRTEHLYRRRPPKCINYHPEEMEIKFCGGVHRYVLTLDLFIITLLLNFT